jgi:hypothetical protein
MFFLSGKAGWASGFSILRNLAGNNGKEFAHVDSISFRMVTKVGLPWLGTCEINDIKTLGPPDFGLHFARSDSGNHSLFILDNRLVWRPQGHG